MLSERTRRVRWLTREEAARLLEVLPEHTAELIRFTLATGLHERNVTHLGWSQPDPGRRMAWIHPDQAKKRRAIAVPLNADAMLVLRRREGDHPEPVFTYQGRPVTRANTKAWRHALAALGIEDFRWHDLRHTWASWPVRSATPLHALQELGAGPRCRWCSATPTARSITWPEMRIGWPVPAQFPAQSQRKVRAPRRRDARNLLSGR